MSDSIVIKTDEIKAEMVNHIKQNMTITLSLTRSLTLNQVDKYFHRVTTIPLERKKTLAAHAGTASNFFLG